MHIDFLVFTFSLTGCSFTDCLDALSPKENTQEQATVTAIALDGKTNITVGDFDFSDYKIILSMSDDTTKKVVLKNENVSNGDLQKLNTVGEHKVTITYDSLKTEVEFVIKKRIENTVTLSFNVDGKRAYFCDIEKGEILTKETAQEKYLADSSGMVGYKVDKWYEDIALEKEFEFNKKIYSNITLYGKSKYIVNSPINSEQLEKFNNALETKRLTISNRDELNAYVFYSIFFNVTESQSPSIKLDYLSSKQSIRDEFNAAFENNKNTSNYNCGSSVEMTGLASSGKFYVSEDGLHDYATKTFNSKGHLYSQQKYALIKNFNKTRKDSFDDFNIKNVATTITVTSSEQLYYALEMGFNPLCAKDSKAEKVYNKAKTVLREICNDEMDNLEKIYAIYNWLILNVQYDNYAYEQSNSITPEQSRLYDSWFAEGVFNNKKAVCEGFAKALLIMAKIENIPCVYVTGNGHAWNKVFVDGKWFVIDATHGNVLIPDNTKGIESVTYTQFLVTDKYKSSLHYTTTDHPEIVANTTLDFYESVDFVYNDEYFDFNVNRLDEFENLVKYIKANAVNTPFVFEITIDNPIISIEDLSQVLRNQSYSTLSFSSNETATGKTAYMLFVK